jgi:hypothetical protein
MASKIDLISNALILIGDLPINTLTGNSRAQIVASNLYDTIVKNELTRTRWGFARAKAQLSLTTETPLGNDYKSIYQLPTDLLLLIKVEPSTRYQILGDKIYCNLKQAMYCDYIYNAPESEWPEYFAKLIQYALAKDFATSIRDSAAARAEMSQEYLNASADAMSRDAQQYPQTPMTYQPFIAVRY